MKNILSLVYTYSEGYYTIRILNALIRKVVKLNAEDE